WKFNRNESNLQLRWHLKMTLAAVVAAKVERRKRPGFPRTFKPTTPASFSFPRHLRFPFSIAKSPNCRYSSQGFNHRPAFPASAQRLRQPGRTAYLAVDIA